MKRIRITVAIFLLLVLMNLKVNGQDNYEIQVYPSETVCKGCTMLELHSNVTSTKLTSYESGVFHTDNLFRETVEITYGFNSWFETGLYLFNAIGDEHRTDFVGSHIRPRVRVPEKWHLPVGISLSAEAGYQKRAYSPDDWNMELRLIIDKSWHRFYFALNPTVEKSFHGLNQKAGVVFAPAAKIGFGLSKVLFPGLEYYSSLGELSHFSTYQDQQHLLFVTLDIEVSPKWELNAGYGFGGTPATETNLTKLIIGYRFSGRRNRII